MRIRRFFSIALFATGLPSSGASKEMVDPNSKIRHSVNTRPSELNVDAKETYNDKFMALMESACRPEPDGYFGATFGDPVKLQYGFQLEAQPLSNMVGLLDIVEDKIVDSILQNSFPQVCGFRRRRLANAASGFRFLKFQEVDKCEPVHDPSNFCGIFTGLLNVYGRDKEEATKQVFQLIEEALNPSDPTKLHSELVDMTSAKQYTKVSGGNVKLMQTSKRKIMGWVSITLVGIIFFLSIWWFFIRGKKRMDSGSSSRKNDRNQRMWARFYKRRPHENLAYYQEEKSIGTHSEEDGDGLLTMDSPPMYPNDSFSVVSVYRDEESTASGHMI